MYMCVCVCVYVCVCVCVCVTFIGCNGLLSITAPPLQLDDSFVGTPFSSVSNLDNSLNLPSFTPQMLEQEQHNRRNRLDPFTDSLDISFGSNFTDGGQRPRGLARVDEAEEDSSPSHHYTAEGRPPPPPYYAPRNRRHLANK